MTTKIYNYFLFGCCLLEFDIDYQTQNTLGVTTMFGGIPKCGMTFKHDCQIQENWVWYICQIQDA